MDVFVEQLVKIRFKGLRLAAFLFTWIAGVLLASAFGAASFLFGFGALGFLAACGIIYGTWWSASQFKLEYEYSITNGEVDIDSIINQRKRKKELNFLCSEIESLKKYSPENASPTNVTRRIVACNPDENSYTAIVRTKKGDAVCLVFSPDENMLEGIKKYLPKAMVYEVFGTEK